jgi:hypothetical protein
MPDWLIQVIIQYPIVVIVGLVAWYAHRELKRTNADAQAHERQLHTDAVAHTKSTYERIVEAQAEEISRLSKELKDEVRKLAKVVTELNERLNS